MELDRLAVRCVVSYLLLLMLLRGAGKRGLQQASPFDFVLAICVGDLVDDVVWAEVPISQFVVAAVGLLTADLALSAPLRRSLDRGSRIPRAPGT